MANSVPALRSSTSSSAPRAPAVVHATSIAVAWSRSPACRSDLPRVLGHALPGPPAFATGPRRPRSPSRPPPCPRRPRRRRAGSRAAPPARARASPRPCSPSLVVLLIAPSPACSFLASPTALLRILEADPLRLRPPLAVPSRILAQPVPALAGRSTASHSGAPARSAAPRSSRTVTGALRPSRTNWIRRLRAVNPSGRRSPVSRFHETHYQHRVGNGRPPNGSPTCSGGRSSLRAPYSYIHITAPRAATLQQRAGAFRNAFRKAPARPPPRRFRLLAARREPLRSRCRCQEERRAAALPADIADGDEHGPVRPLDDAHEVAAELPRADVIRDASRSGP